MKKSKSIIVLGVILGLFSLFGLLGVISSLSSPHSAYDLANSMFPEGFLASQGFTSNFALISDIVRLPLEALMLVGAIGLIGYKNWGRKLVIWAIALKLLSSVINIVFLLVTGRISVLVVTILPYFMISLVIYGLVLLFLIRTKTKEYFQPAKAL